MASENKIDFSKAFEYETYNELPILHDLYYFKNFIVDVLELEYHKASLLLEFKDITKKVEQLSPRGIMIRDFQARNIMVDENNIFFIDYQGAMEGPLMYDVISFLFQAKANFPENFKSEMLEYYISHFKDEKTKKSLQNSIDWLKLMRFLQVLGAYGFRGLIQRKPHFIASLDQGIKNITAFIDSWELSKDYPELQKVISQLNSAPTQQKIEQIIN
jgi:aminoglycoside/choline kinase family phosphotransferase